MEFCKEHPWILGLVITGFAFRISGIFWGIPPVDAGYYHPDEPKIIQGASHFPNDIFSRRDFRYPTFCHYSLGILALPLRLACGVTGHDPYLLVYFTGRILSVLGGSLSILLLYLFTREAFDEAHAWIAAFVLTFSLFHVTNSAWATTDVASSFLLVTFLLVLLTSLRTDSRIPTLLAGLALGFLVGTKYTGAIAVIPLILLFVIQRRRQWDASIRQVLARLSRDSKLWTIIVVGVAACLLSTPGILIRPQDFLDSMSYETARMEGLQGSILDPAIWIEQFSVLSRTVGIPLALVTCVGLVISLYRRSGPGLVLGVMFVAFLLYFRGALYPRYVILMIPIMAIFSSVGLRFLLSRNPRSLRILGAVVAAVVLGHAVVYSTKGILSRYPDTRTQSTDFVAETIPPGSTVGIAYTSPKYGWTTHAWRYPVVDFDIHPYKDFLAYPDYLIVSSYDADRIRRTLELGVLSNEYRLPENHEELWYRSSPPSPEIFEMFDRIYFLAESPYELMARFAPNEISAPIELPPPTIELFRKKNETREVARPH